MNETNKKKLIIATLVPAFAFAIAGAGVAIATATFAAEDTPSTTVDCPMQQGPHRGMPGGPMLDERAEVLGMTADELTAAHDEGLTFAEILEMQGMTEEEFQTAMDAKREEFQAQHQATLKAHLDELVAEGTLTQDEADQRYADMLDRMENHEERGFGPHMERPAQGDANGSTFSGMGKRGSHQNNNFFGEQSSN